MCFLIDSAEARSLTCEFHFLKYLLIYQWLGFQDPSKFLYDLFQIFLLSPQSSHRSQGETAYRWFDERAPSLT